MPMTTLYVDGTVSACTTFIRGLLFKAANQPLYHDGAGRDAYLLSLGESLFSGEMREKWAKRKDELRSTGEAVDFCSFEFLLYEAAEVYEATLAPVI